MTKRFLQALHFQQSFLSTFFFFALVTSCGVAFSRIPNGGMGLFLLDYPFTAILVAYNFICFFKVSESIKYLPFSKYYPVALYGQSLLYLGVAYDFQDNGAAFLGILPALTGVLALSKLWRIGEKEGEHRFQTYFYLLTLTYGWFHFLGPSFIKPHFSEFSQEQSLFLPLFFGQVFALALFPSFIQNRQWPSLKSESFTHFLKTMVKEGDRYTDFDNQNRKDRYFFHDMINHLYGISLKLTYRLSKGKGLEKDELGPLLNEVMALQNLLSDHFGFKHKNINHSFDYMPFNEMKDLIHSQIQSFFGEKTRVEIIYSGVFDQGHSHEFSSPSLPFASFYRILTNLLKNAREAKAQNIEIIFDGDFHQLSMKMKNDFHHLGDNPFELSEGLSKVIQAQSHQNSSQGLGLAAVESLCREHGGEFSFDIKDGFWANYLTLPYGEDIASETEYQSWLMAKDLKVGTKKAA